MNDADLKSALREKGKKQALKTLELVEKGLTNAVIVYEGKGITGDPVLEPHAIAFVKARGIGIQTLPNPLAGRAKTQMPQRKGGGTSQ